MVWLIAAASFVVCVGLWHFRNGITLIEACGIFLASVTSFLASHNYVVERNTADSYIASGTVTSKVYRPSYTYYDGDNNLRTEPEHWIIEQAPVAYDPLKIKYVSRPYVGHRKGLRETCFGLCRYRYPEGEMSRRYWTLGKIGENPVILHDVSSETWGAAQLGDPAAAKVTFQNPLRANADIIYTGAFGGTITTPTGLSTPTTLKPIPYFDNNIYVRSLTFNRLQGPSSIWIDDATNDRIERLNSKLNQTMSISVGLIVTNDPLYYEKLRRSWYGGKPNDFVVVVHAYPDYRIANINVLTWQNYQLVQHVVQALRQAPSAHTDDIIPRLEQALLSGPRFTPFRLDNLSYLAIHIPDADMAFMLSYQIILCLYLLLMLSLDPSSKNTRTNWDDIFETWRRGGTPSSWRYYLHPFSSTGVFVFYSMIPLFLFHLWEGVFTPFRTLPGLY